MKATLKNSSGEKVEVHLKKRTDDGVAVVVTDYNPQPPPPPPPS